MLDEKTPSDIRRNIMNSTVSVTDAQAQLPRLLKELGKTGSVTVQRHGEVAAFIVSPERMQAIVETMEILANPDAMKAIEAYEAGKLEFEDLSVLDED